MGAPIAKSESERLETLMAYRILDTPAEGEFDGYARMIAQLCGTMIGAVTLLDRERQWCKAVHGPLARQIPRDHSFCPFTILQNDVLEVPDARLDERFAGSPLVVGDPYVRFYAGAPLLTRSGVALGTLCVLDPRPLQLSPSQRRLMVIAAAHIAVQLECRRAVLQLLEQKTLATESRDALTASNRRQQELTAMMVHDFKSPLAVLELDATFLVDDLSLAQPQREVAREIMDAGRQLSGMVSDLLDVSSSEDGQLIVQRSPNIDVEKLARDVVETARTLAADRRQRVEVIKVCKHALIDGDAKIVTRVLSNLLDNANKYAPRGSSIRLELSEEGGFVIVRVVDEGTGIPPDQRESVFDKYFQIETGGHARPSDGLAFCRIAVEAHGGTIKVEDTTTGCVFRVTLPASPHV